VLKYGADGKQMLFLRHLDAGTTEPLPGTGNGKFPFWSPDGKSLGFFADEQLKSSSFQEVHLSAWRLQATVEEELGLEMSYFLRLIFMKAFTACRPLAARQLLSQRWIARNTQLTVGPYFFLTENISSILQRGTPAAKKEMPRCMPRASTEERLNSFYTRVAVSFFHLAMIRSQSCVDESRDFFSAEDRRKVNCSFRIGRLDDAPGFLESFDVEESQSCQSLRDRGRRQLALLEQHGLIFTNVFWTQTIWRTLESF
jgi:WD40-like Beta Propeller Repeat